jgi:hypothetical protein
MMEIQISVEYFYSSVATHGLLPIKNKMKIRELVVEAGAVNCFGTTY